MDSFAKVERKKKVKNSFLSVEQTLELQEDLKIDNLAKILQSKESQNLQLQGWKFSRVQKNFGEGPVQQMERYLYLNNKYGDVIVFEMEKEAPRPHVQIKIPHKKVVEKKVPVSFSVLGESEC